MLYKQIILIPRKFYIQCNRLLVYLLSIVPSALIEMMDGVMRHVGSERLKTTIESRVNSL